MKTRAAVLVNTKEPLELWELETPPLGTGQVLVQIVYSGFCHSQLNEMKGLKGEDKFLPHTLGHEGSGIVVEVGPGVTKVKSADRVVLSWIKGEGADVPGCRYTSSHGMVNSGAISTFLTYAVISENRLIPIPSEMPLKEAALLGCAIPTGAGVVKNEMAIPKGASFAVFGVGGVGLSALLAAKQAEAFPRIAVDVHAEKLEKAKKMGATHTVDASQQNALEAIQSITQGKGVDYVFESAGKREAMEQAFAALKAPGGHCVLAGNLPKGEKIAIDPFDLIRGKRITGTWGGGSRIEADVAFYVEAFLSGQLDLGSLITHIVSLNEINQLAHDLEKGCVGRGLIAF